MPDSLDVILSLTQNQGFLRSGSRVGARDNSPLMSCRTPIRHLRPFERAGARSRIGSLRDDWMGEHFRAGSSGQALRDDRIGTLRDDGPFGSSWRAPSQDPGLSFLPVILSLTQNHGFLRSGSRVGARDDSMGTLRDDSPLTSFWHVPSQNHVLHPSRHAGH